MLPQWIHAFYEKYAAGDQSKSCDCLQMQQESQISVSQFYQRLCDWAPWMIPLFTPALQWRHKKQRAIEFNLRSNSIAGLNWLAVLP
jgi:hypothetical protein